MTEKDTVEIEACRQAREHANTDITQQSRTEKQTRKQTVLRKSTQPVSDAR